MNAMELPFLGALYTRSALKSRKRIASADPYGRPACGSSCTPDVNPLMRMEAWQFMQITCLFAKSLKTGRVPQEWKIAKIMLLQKPKRRDYTVVGNHKPISILPTLGKALESLKTERIAYLVEKYSLLPKDAL